jgi:hypothetical protein
MQTSVSNNLDIKISSPFTFCWLRTSSPWMCVLLFIQNTTIYFQYMKMSQICIFIYICLPQDLSYWKTLQLAGLGP